MRRRRRSRTRAHALPAVQDRMALEKMEVKLAAKPLRAPSAALGAVIGMRMLTRLETLQLPRVVRAAADNSGNPSACFVCASVCEVRHAATPCPAPALTTAQP